MMARTTPRKLRRRLLLWSFPAVLLAGALGLLFIVQHVIAQTAVTQHFEDKHEEALNTSGQLTLINIVERWKPHYNMGTSYLELDALSEASDQFVVALDLAAPAEQCPIRANYAITLEREGDDMMREGDVQSAMTKYQEAIELIEAQDPTCDTSSSNRSLDDSLERIREKLQQQQQPEQDGENDSAPPESQPNPDALDELEDGLDGNKEDRENNLQDDQNSGGGAGGVEEPW